MQLGVIWKTHKLTLIGIALGTIASYASARLIATLLFGTRPTDPSTYAVMVVLLFLVATMAGYLPARRATRVDPMLALRYE